MEAKLRSAAVLAVTCALLLSGCSPPTVWRMEARSPDGRYVATARTVQYGGFGSADIVTSVYLEQANIPETRMAVLSFSCDGPVPRPYTLDDKANAGGTIGLRLRWQSPTHLSVTYDGGATVDFQAIRYQGIIISLTALSTRSAGSPPQPGTGDK